jgi:two-component system, OmpR family, aerobic respiration control sensor histidine kinase ArcB
MQAISEKTTLNTLSHTEQRHSFSTNAPQEEAPKDLNILVVEDNRLIQFAVKAMLTELGCNFDIAADGHSAIGLAITQKRYDLVLMDIDLPDISGIEATKIILSLENAKNLPIVAMTSHTEPEYMERCYAVGMIGFYNKPKDTYAIRRIIQTHVVS